MVNDRNHRHPSAATASFRYTAPMLFMVIERFKQANLNAVGERFREKGRMLPEGIAYYASWMEDSGARCFQIMEAPGADAFVPWVRCWEDLVDFEIVPVLTSADFWARAAHE